MRWSVCAATTPDDTYFAEAWWTVAQAVDGSGRDDAAQAAAARQLELHLPSALVHVSE